MYKMLVVCLIAGAMSGCSGPKSLGGPTQGQRSALTKGTNRGPAQQAQAPGVSVPGQNPDAYPQPMGGLTPAQQAAAAAARSGGGGKSGGR